MEKEPENRLSLSDKLILITITGRTIDEKAETIKGFEQWSIVEQTGFRIIIKLRRSDLTTEERSFCSNGNYYTTTCLFPYPLLESAALADQTVNPAFYKDLLRGLEDWQNLTAEVNEVMDLLLWSGRYEPDIRYPSPYGEN